MLDLKQKNMALIVMFLLSAATYTVPEHHDVTYTVYSIGGDELESITLNHKALEVTLKDNRCLSLAQLQEITTVPESLRQEAKFVFNQDQSVTVVKVADKFHKPLKDFDKLTFNRKEFRDRYEYLNKNPDVVVVKYEYMSITFSIGLLDIDVCLPLIVKPPVLCTGETSLADAFEILEKLVDGREIKWVFRPQIAKSFKCREMAWPFVPRAVYGIAKAKSQKITKTIEGVIKENIGAESQVYYAEDYTEADLPPKKVLQLFRALDAAVNTPEILQATLS